MPRVETARADLPSASAGRSAVYVQGEDASGARGPVGAAFVDMRAAEKVAQLAGRVSRIADSAAVAGAQVRVGGFLATADGKGQYARRVPVEASVIEVEAAGYEPLRIEGLSLQPGSLNTRDLQLYAYCPLLTMDAEQGNQGWTATRPSGGTPLWSIVQTSPQAGTRAWHDSPGGSYANNLDTQLTSPAFDLQGYSGARLRLRSFCDTESGYDFGTLQVRSAPTETWTTVYSCSGDPAGAASTSLCRRSKAPPRRRSASV
jgi:carboxypeptidase T